LYNCLLPLEPSRWAELPAEEITPKALHYTAGRRKWNAGCTVEALPAFMGHADVETTWAWVKELQTGEQQNGAGYQSRRRKRGGTIGNSNAGVLTRYLAEMLRTEGLGEQIPTRGVVR
jgi:hypothetical protein